MPIIRQRFSKERGISPSARRAHLERTSRLVTGFHDNRETGTAKVRSLCTTDTDKRDRASSSSPYKNLYELAPSTMSDTPCITANSAMKSASISGIAKNEMPIKSVTMPENKVQPHIGS